MQIIKEPNWVFFEFNQPISIILNFNLFTIGMVKIQSQMNVELIKSVLLSTSYLNIFLIVQHIFIFFFT